MYLIYKQISAVHISIPGSLDCPLPSSLKILISCIVYLLKYEGSIVLTSCHLARMGKVSRYKKEIRHPYTADTQKLTNPLQFRGPMLCFSCRCLSHYVKCKFTLCHALFTCFYILFWLLNITKQQYHCGITYIPTYSLRCIYFSLSHLQPWFLFRNPPSQ